MIARYLPRRASLRRAGAAGLVLLGALGGGTGGCTGRVQEDASAGPTSAGATAPTDLPPGAIRVGRDLYQVPIGTDADGCPMYRLYSPTLLVTQAISYRSRDGSFTIDKQAAACDPDR